MPVKRPAPPDADEPPSKRAKIDIADLVSLDNISATIEIVRPVDDDKSKKPIPATTSPIEIADQDIDLSDLSDVPDDISEVEQTNPSVRHKEASKITKQSAISKKFTHWEPKMDVPAPNDAWGTKPYPGPEGPQPHPGSPSARESYAATKVPLWEDRKWKFKKGRYQKTFYDDKYLNHLKDDAKVDAELDQEDNLVIPLIDMRAISKSDRNPRRQPTYYVYENGKPKDWTDKITLHTINDRRREGIRRITEDPPWTRPEREYLAMLLADYPDASITELAEHFNYRFAGEIKGETAFHFHEQYELRTLESVRAEYLEHKPVYDAGRVPCPRRQEDDKVLKKQRNDKRKEEQDREDLFWRFYSGDIDHETGERTLQSREAFKAVFGYNFGEIAPGKRGGKGTRKTTLTRHPLGGVTKASNKSRSPKVKTSKTVIKESDKSVTDSVVRDDGYVPPPPEQQEELLHLAGYYSPDDVRSSHGSRPSTDWGSSTDAGKSTSKDVSPSSHEHQSLSMSSVRLHFKVMPGSEEILVGSAVEDAAVYSEASSKVAQPVIDITTEDVNVVQAQSPTDSPGSEVSVVFEQTEGKPEQTTVTEKGTSPVAESKHSDVFGSG